jgi:hypothetical protein
MGPCKAMKPNVRQFAQALLLLGGVLHQSSAIYCAGGRVAFELEAGWVLVLAPDDAARWRLDACHGGVVRATMWCFADDHQRLMRLASSMREQVAARIA